MRIFLRPSLRLRGFWDMAVVELSRSMSRWKEESSINAGLRTGKNSSNHGKSEADHQADFEIFII